jgi:hypothetical protein
VHGGGGTATQEEGVVGGGGGTATQEEGVVGGGGGTTTQALSQQLQETYLGLTS